MNRKVLHLNTPTGPWENLPNVSKTSPESVFIKKFASLYADKSAKSSFGIREFQCSGHGIADLIWVKKPRKQSDLPIIVAFEMKMKDWKKGLMQAYRYSYYADASYLVVPIEIVDTVKKYTKYFLEMNIGLIVYSPSEKKITTLIKPNHTNSLSKSAKKKALVTIDSNFQLSFLRK